MRLNELTQAVKTILGARLFRAMAPAQAGYAGVQQRFNRERALLRAAKRAAGGQRQWKRARTLERRAGR